MEFHKDVMNTIEIKNERILSLLETSRKFADPLIMKWLPLSAAKEDKERWVNHEYMNYIVDLGVKHNGYPPSSKSYSLSMKQIRFIKEAPEEIVTAITKKATELHCQLLQELGAHRNALWAVYPPGGYIAWHNNANAPGYNILFTWSENGDGYWEHLDPTTGKVVRINDVPGWQCKYGYYGPYSEGNENLVYHAAATNCWRMTVAFIFNRDERGKNMARMLLEEISEA